MDGHAALEHQRDHAEWRERLNREYVGEGLDVRTPSFPAANAESRCQPGSAWLAALRVAGAQLSSQRSSQMQSELRVLDCTRLASVVSLLSRARVVHRRLWTVFQTLLQPAVR